MGSDLSTGTILLGKYRIEGILGRGGFGLVYKATDLLLNRAVAIKILSQSQTTLEERLGEGAFDSYLARFRREATVSAYFTQNRNIITVYGLEQDDQNYYLILEFLENGSLSDLLKTQPILPVNQACAIAYDICNALTEIHQHPADIVHRDLKPGNILLRKNGQAVVADFGIAQLGQESQRTTEPTLRHPGSPAYMSPEQAGGYGYLTPASDLYSLGLILYQMLTGRSYLKTRALPPSRMNGQIPGWLDDLVTKLVQDNAKDRFQDAEEVAQIIEAQLGPALQSRNLKSGSLPANQSTLFINPTAPASPQEQTTPLPYNNPNLNAPTALAAPASRKISPALLYGGLLGILAIIVAAVLILLNVTGGPKPNPTSLPVATSTAAPATAAPTATIRIEATLSVNNPAISTVVASTPTPQPTATTQPTATAIPRPTNTAIATATPLPSFKADTAAIQQALQNLPGTVSGQVILPDNRAIGNKADLQVPSASVIKLWIAATYYEETKAGRINPNDSYTIKGSDIASGTGILRNSVGKSFSYNEIMETTLVYSDNSGANIILNRISGFDKVNNYIERNGYRQTKIQRFLGDVSNPNNNFTSAQDCALYFQRLLKDQIIDATISNQIRSILLRRENDAYDRPYNFFSRKLPGSTIYLHISGTGTGIRNEVGSFNLQQGEPVIAAILVSQAKDDEAEEAVATAILQIFQAVK